MFLCYILCVQNLIYGMGEFMQRYINVVFALVFSFLSNVSLAKNGGDVLGLTAIVNVHAHGETTSICNAECQYFL
jgi:hypothetical protein